MVMLALCLTCAGALGIYWAAPQQRLLPAPSPATALRRLGVALLVAGVALWCVALHPVAGFFAALTVVMGCWVLLPYLAAWRLARRAVAHHPHREDRDGAA